MIVDALSRRHNLLAILETRMIGFEMIKEQYVGDPGFNDLYTAYLKEPQSTFHIQ